MVNIYEKLREKLDGMAIGFPPSGSGVELRILEQLFSIEDAEVFLAMKEEYQFPSEVAGRLKAGLSSVVKKMEGMAKRGLIFRLNKDGEVSFTESSGSIMWRSRSSMPSSRVRTADTRFEKIQAIQFVRHGGWRTTVIT